MDHAYKWNMSSLKGKRGYTDLDLSEEKGLEPRGVPEEVCKWLTDNSIRYSAALKHSGLLTTSPIIQTPYKSNKEF